MRKNGGVGKLDDLNLIPIMSVLVILVPMMVYAFNYNELAVQEVSLPKTGGASAAQGPKKLNLTVLVSDEGFRIKLQGETESGTLPEDQVIPKKMISLCDQTDQYLRYDYVELYNRIVKLKDQKDLGLEDSVNIGAKDNIPWRVLARTIDAVRSRKVKDSFTNYCEYLKTDFARVDKKDATGKPIRPPVDLFPKIVFIVL